MIRSRCAPRLPAVLVALLLALPLSCLGVTATPAAPTNTPLSHADYPLGSWKMFHANPEHTGEGSTSVPPAGQVVWSYADPFNRSSDTPEGGAVVDQGQVFVGLGNRMTSLNSTTGSKLWSFPSSGRILSTPALWNGLVFFGAGGSPGADNFFAWNASTGATVWKANETANLGLVQFVHDSPTVANGIVYYGSYTYWFYARDALNGSLRWSANLSSEVLASPAESDGIVYVASAGIHNPAFNFWDVLPRVWAFNALTGAEVWNQSVAYGHLRASPVIANGVVYVATAGFSYATTDIDSGYVLALNASNGSLVWASPDIGRVVATPALQGNFLYVATAGQQGSITNTDARLRKLDLTASGSEVWAQPVGASAAMDSSPAVAGNLVVAAARDGTVGVWTTGGIRVWSYTLPDEVVAPPAVVDEMILVASLDGGLYAFGAQPDFSVKSADISISDTTPHVGEPLSLSTIVRNIGDKKGSGTVSISVNYSGNVTVLSTQNISDLNFGAAFAAQAPFSAQGEGLHEVIVEISNVTPKDGNLSNNLANYTVMVWARLDGWRARYADEHGSNFLETATPQNNIPRWTNLSFGATGSGAIAFDSTVVFARDDTLFAFARDNGSFLRWAYLAPEPIVGTPALAAGFIVIATAQPNDTVGSARFIDPDTGATAGIAPLPARPTVSPVPLDSKVLLGLSDRLVVLSVANRSVEQEFGVIDVPLADRPAIRTEPAVAVGLAFVLSSVGEIHAYNLTTGAEPAPFPLLLEEPTGVPLVAAGAFLFAVNGSTNVSAFALGALTSIPSWTADLAEPIAGPLGFAYGRLVAAGRDGNVSAFSAGSGTRVWNRTLVLAPGSSALRAMGNDTIFVGGDALFALSATDGQVRWEYEPGPLGSMVGPAALNGGALHLQTTTGALVTLGLVPGAPPIAVIESPTAGATLRVGASTLFSANGTYDADAQVLTYVWDFGDGSYGGGNNTTHTYSFAGTFLVRLTVTDDHGLSSSRTALVEVIVNQPPVLTTGLDSLEPSIVGHAWLDSTVWTFRVNYTDGNGDPPTYILVNISNEPVPLKDMVPEDAGPHDFSLAVSYVWVGVLLSGRHSYSFSASDGLNETSTQATSTFEVFRDEQIEATPLTIEARYVGLGSSNVTFGVNIAAPAGLGVIDRVRVTLPPNATSVQWLNISYQYGITDISLVIEQTIQFYWFNQETTEWDQVFDSGILPGQMAWANQTRGGIFGLFATPKVPVQHPVAVIQVRDERSVFSPGEAVEFTGTGSTDPGDLSLTYLWDFGDGNTSTLPITTHAYNRTGYYVVRLTVTNEFGLNNSVTYPITIRTEASASAFLGIAAAIVAGLFALFVLLPAWRRRAQPPPPRRESPSLKTADETAPPKNRRDVKPSKKASRAALQTGSSSVTLDDEQAAVIEELERDFENGKNPKAPP